MMSLPCALMHAGKKLASDCRAFVMEHLVHKDHCSAQHVVRRVDRALCGTAAMVHIIPLALTYSPARNARVLAFLLTQISTRQVHVLPFLHVNIPAFALVKGVVKAPHDTTITLPVTLPFIDQWKCCER